MNVTQYATQRFLLNDKRQIENYYYLNKKRTPILELITTGYPGTTEY